MLELEAAELDALVLDDRSPPPPMLVGGSFEVLRDAASLERFLVGGEVLDTNVFDGRRCPSEQTALGLWRIARIRGGAFWDGVANVVARWAGGRVRRAEGMGPVHGLWGEGETHVRFLADAALLLVAAGDEAGAGRAFEFLEGYARPFGGGTWYLHDSVEAGGGGNDLVVNTHAQVMAARAASGRTTAAEVVALDAAVALRLHTAAEVVRAGAVAAAVGAADLLAGRGPRRGVRRARLLADGALARLAEGPAGGRVLRLPGGYLTRDVRRHGAPGYYLAVNLHDIGALVANGLVDPEGRTARTFRSCLRWARATAAFPALRRGGVGVAALEPIVWHQAKRPDLARGAAEALQRSGFALLPASPGHVDNPWPAFAPGTL